MDRPKTLKSFLRLFIPNSSRFSRSQKILFFADRVKKRGLLFCGVTRNVIRTGMRVLFFKYLIQVVFSAIIAIRTSSQVRSNIGLWEYFFQSPFVYNTFLRFEHSTNFFNFRRHLLIRNNGSANSMFNLPSFNNRFEPSVDKIPF